jgi:hypothetical protein
LSLKLDQLRLNAGEDGGTIDEPALSSRIKPLRDLLANGSAIRIGHRLIVIQQAKLGCAPPFFIGGEPIDRFAHKFAGAATFDGGNLG